MNRLIGIMIAMVGVALSSGATAVDIGTHKGKPNFVPNEIIVIYDKSITSERKASIRQAYGLTKKRDSRKSGAFVVYKHHNPRAILSILKHEPGIISVEQNPYAYAYTYPNDPYYSPYQWHMMRIGVESAWDHNTGEGVTVAVIDTGVKQSLQDLAGTSFTIGYDFVNSDNDPTDDEGHGSHVAGTIAQTTNNWVGVAGIAYNATLMPIKVLDQRGRGTHDEIADGIYFAVDNGADIINLSLGGSSSSTTLKTAIDYAWEQGVVVVCAAGNESTNAPSYPAAYNNAISVSATTYLDSLASYSNYGETIDIAAPGGDSGDNNGDGYDDMILQNTFSRRGENYYFYAGTSMASPHVAGVAALVKSANPNLSNGEIRRILESTAEDLGGEGKDQSFGHGLVDAYAAVQAAGGNGGGTTNIPPTASFSYSCSELSCVFNDTSSDSDGSVTAWSWDFGDGTTSTAQNANHTYAVNGTYTVTLTVTDDGDATDDVTQSITVQGMDTAPTVTGMSPDTMQRGTTKTVVITGAGFANGATVSFSGGSGPTPVASNVSVVSTTSITADVTTQDGGPPRNRFWDVTVTNLDGRSTTLDDGLMVTP